MKSPVTASPLFNKHGGQRTVSSTETPSGGGRVLLKICFASTCETKNQTVFLYINTVSIFLQEAALSFVQLHNTVYNHIFEE